MHTSVRRYFSWVTALTALAAVMLAPALTFAKDVVHLKDGTTLEGTIERETDSAIFLIISVGEIQQHKLIRLTEIDHIDRDKPATPEAPPSGAPTDGTKGAGAAGATKVAFITLEEMVGPFFNKDAIEHSINILKDLPEDQKPEIVVFWVDSGGGALFELVKIMPYLTEEVKPNFRTVAWIRSAISAAAMSVWPIEEIYMMREGNIGACTAFSSGAGGTQAMAGESLERLLAEMEKYSIEGGKDPLIMRAMEVYMTLSCDIDKDGKITWYDNDQGAIAVKSQNEILTLNALDAVKYGVARGIADTKDELAKAMGLVEWVEVGQKADEYQQEFRKNVKAAQTEINELRTKLNIAVNFASSAQDEKERDRQIGVARSYLKEIKSWVTRAPSLELYEDLTPEWFREMDQRLKDFAKPH